MFAPTSAKSLKRNLSGLSCCLTAFDRGKLFETIQRGEFTMATRNGSAVWEGTVKEGKGTIKLGSGAFEGPYSFSSRFEDGKGTNPEELIGAAHAGCFSMALSGALTRAGLKADKIATEATVTLEKLESGFA